MNFFVEAPGPADLILCALLVASSVTDLRERRIYNAFTYPAIVGGLVLSLIQGETVFLSAAAATVLGFVVFYPFYRAGGMGMGDLKLMAAIGALKGISFWAAAMVDSALAGGVMALAATVRRGTALETLARSLRVPWEMVRAAWTGERTRVPREGRVTVPYGVAIAAGAAAAWILEWPW